MNDEFQDIKVMIRQALPGAEPGWDDVFPFLRESLTAPTSSPAIDVKAEKARLDALRKGVLQAKLSIQQMHPEVRRALEHSFASFSANSDLVHFQVDGEPFHNLHQIRDLIDYLARGLENSAVASPMSVAHRTISSFRPQSTQERNNDTWTRVNLVRQCHLLWFKHTHQIAPRIPSSGPFWEFVSSLIEYHRFGWDVDSVLRAYARRYDEKGFELNAEN